MVSSELTYPKHSPLELLRDDLEKLEVKVRTERKVVMEVQVRTERKAVTCSKCLIRPCTCRKLDKEVGHPYSAMLAANLDKEVSHPDPYAAMLAAISNNCNFCTLLLKPCAYHDPRTRAKAKFILPEELYGSSRKPMIMWDGGSDEVTTSSQVPSSSQEVIPVRKQVKKKSSKRSSPTSTRKRSSPTSTRTSKSTNTRPNSPADKKYRCDHCGRAFGYKHVLQNHIRTHTGEKPFHCNEPGCGKRFTRDHHLQTHKRLHTGEKPYVCNYCGKCFVQVANLRRHLRVHSEKCDIGSCQATFLDPKELNAHKLTHWAKCDIESCQATFLYPNEMTEHKLTHLKTCDIGSCRATFLDPEEMNAHKLTHMCEPTVISHDMREPNVVSEDEMRFSMLFPHPSALRESPTHVTSSSNFSVSNFSSSYPRVIYYSDEEMRPHKEEEIPSQEEPEDLSLKTGRRRP